MPARGPSATSASPPRPLPAGTPCSGSNTQYNPTRRVTFDVAARGTVIRYAEDMNPFVYALSASLGYRHYTDAGGNAGVVGLGFDLVLPVG